MTNNNNKFAFLSYNIFRNKEGEEFAKVTFIKGNRTAEAYYNGDKAKLKELKRLSEYDFIFDVYVDKQGGLKVSLQDVVLIVR